MSLNQSKEDIEESFKIAIEMIKNGATMKETCEFVHMKESEIMYALQKNAEAEEKAKEKDNQDLVSRIFKDVRDIREILLRVNAKIDNIVTLPHNGNDI